MKKAAAICLWAAVATLTPMSGAYAADHQVQMLNKDSEGRIMQFEPAFLQIAPGDTVTFVPTNPSHNSESLPDLIPEGGEAWKGKINEEITVTFDQEGFYAYRCLPHFGMGMVGLIQVGESATPPAPEAFAKAPPKAKARFEELLAQATGDAAPSN